ncbi:hypothetical protein BST26_03045, partial [Mycolicibacterium insubricum]
GVDAVTSVLADAGVDLKGVSLRDSSGLSVDDRLTATTLDDLMVVASGTEHPKLRPLLSRRLTPLRSTPASASTEVTASTPPEKLAGLCSLTATSRATDSAITLSEAFISSLSRDISGADCTEPSSAPLAGPGAVVTEFGSTPSAAASARPASRAGVSERFDSTLVGWTRPPSSITGSIGATSPPSMSSGSQPGAIFGPL